MFKHVSYVIIDINLREVVTLNSCDMRPILVDIRAKEVIFVDMARCARKVRSLPANTCLDQYDIKKYLAAVEDCCGYAYKRDYS
jgi:hypothetical protein